MLINDDVYGNGGDIILKCGDYTYSKSLQELNLKGILNDLIRNHNWTSEDIVRILNIVLCEEIMES